MYFSKKYWYLIFPKIQTHKNFTRLKLNFFRQICAHCSPQKHPLNLTWPVASLRCTIPSVPSSVHAECCRIVRKCCEPVATSLGPSPMLAQLCRFYFFEFLFLKLNFLIIIFIFDIFYFKNLFSIYLFF